MAKLITLTMNPSLDKSAAVDQVLPEHKLRCRDEHYDPGGGGINVSRVLKRFGLSSLTLYPRGGPYGEFLDQLLLAEDITIQSVPTKGWTREGIAIYEASSSNQYRFNMPGPTLTGDEVQAILDTLQAEINHETTFVVASGSLPQGVKSDFYRQVGKICAPYKCRFIVDSSGPALKQALGHGVFLAKPNLGELRDLVGASLENDQEIREAVCSLIQHKASTALVVSLGSAGAILATKDEYLQLRAPTVKIQSKVGAGDSMVAGIVFSLANGQTLKEAASYGVACGAAAVSTPASELCWKADADALYHLIRP